MQNSIETASGQGRLFESILDAVGNAPTIKINCLSLKNKTNFVKVEFFKPGAILCMIIDAAKRYLSSPLVDYITENMNEQEIAITNSTPEF